MTSIWFKNSVLNKFNMLQAEIDDHNKVYFILKSHLENKIGLVLGKLGANELNFIYTMATEAHKEIYTHNLTTGAGAYPNDYDYLVYFMREKYLPVLKNIDIFAKWNNNTHFEEKLISSPFNLNVKLRSFEPYYFDDNKWTHLLKDKKVLVISSFSETIKKQYKKKDLIWKDNLLPDFELICLKFPLSYYLEHESNRQIYPENSHKLLELFENKISEIDFDIALIGAGIYSLPLAVHCKNLGKIGFHLGGCIQNFFGIKGSRWSGASYINEFWVAPSPAETPAYSQLCEKNCYWS
jgi:hypothetical protein